MVHVKFDSDGAPIGLDWSRFIDEYLVKEEQ